MSLIKRHLDLLACFVAGLFITLPSIVMPLWPLGLVGLAILYAIAERPATWKRRIVQGYCASLSLMTTFFYWLTYTMVVHGHLPVVAAVPLFLLYVLIFGTKVPLLMLLLPWLRERLCISTWLTWPLATVTVEMLQWSLFPWHFGISQAGNLYFLQIVDIVGIAGISFFMGVLAMGVRDLGMRRNPGVVGWVSVAVVLAVVYGYGLARVAQVERLEAAATPRRVLMVQPNTPLRMHRDEASVKYVVQACDRLAREGAKSAGGPLDLIVWPEGGSPFYYNHRELPGHREFTDTVESLARDLHANIMFNDNYAKGPGEVYNNTWALGRDGFPRGNYQKIMLLAFGEYMPLSETFPFLKGLAGVSNFTHGKKIGVIQLDIGTVAPQICYEILYPNFTRKFVRLGADFIVNVTNDAWFGPTTASQQHLLDAFPRAIENRMPIVRCTNSGITTVIDATGRFIVPFTPLYQPTYAVAEIRPPGIRTFYTEHGDVFGWACVLSTAVLVALALSRRAGRRDQGVGE